MMETATDNSQPNWKAFLRRHWGVVAIFIAGAILAFIGGIAVYLWFVGNAQSTGLVPSSLAAWTLGNIVSFVVYLVLWEIVLIGIPVAIAGGIGYLWWRRLPDQEKADYHFFGTRTKTTGGSGGFSLLIFIVFCIKVYLDGNWNVAISTWTFNYLVYSMLTALIWILIPCGIAGAIAGIWWINRETKKP